MGDYGFRRIGRLERSQKSIRVIFLILAVLMVAIGLVLAVIVFVHLLQFTFNPQDLDELVTNWATLLSNTAPTGDGEILDPQEGPARWFATAALLSLGFLLSRIPLILVRMGTTLFHASQDSRRQTQLILREVLLELSQPSSATDVSTDHQIDSAEIMPSEEAETTESESSNRT